LYVVSSFHILWISSVTIANLFN